MAKAPSPKRTPKPKGPAPAEKEALAASKARATFAEQARVRGEVAPTAAAEPLPGAPGALNGINSALYTEDAPGQLTRHRFSLLPPAEDPS
ncbi:MAG: hypothetical protein EOO59_08325 [Hymenobacter sp.]|nr:MAG: hypothetical protein EOO59_08325 [Hymenobacter sp.]